jgi:glycosyltransferase involved in cell wall biosynthesis
VNNGIPDIDEKYIKNQNLNISSKVNILFFSNLIKSKGIDDYLEALGILKSRNRHFKGIIIGAQADFTEKDLDDQLKHMYLSDQVSYLGKQYSENKYKILQEVDIMVFPTKHESFGLVVLEAMQFSIPVISTKEGAIPEIIDDGITGFLVDKNSPEQIAEKLELLINNPELRKSMGRAGRKKYEKKYTLHKFEENMLQVFQRVIQCVE